MRVLDLFCGAGGAAAGYALAGFELFGIDNKPQPRYPYNFRLADALDYLSEHGREFDLIHASPPCQAYTAMRHAPHAKRHVGMIDETRRLLRAIGKPYVIENVVGAPLRNPFLLCGTMFRLGCDGAELRRHRIFETSEFVLAPMCAHGEQPRVIGVYGSHVRNRNRGEGENPNFTVDQGRQAMGISWMTMTELSQAIPPAYTKWIGTQMMSMIGDAR